MIELPDANCRKLEECPDRLISCETAFEPTFEI